MLNLSTCVVGTNLFLRCSVLAGLCFGSSVQARDLLGAISTARISSAILSLTANGGQANFLELPVVDAVTDFADTEAVNRLLLLTEGVAQNAAQCTTGTKSLSGTYENLLKTATWSKDLLTASDRKRLDSLKNLLFQADGKPVPGYLQFLALKKAVDAAAEDLNSTPPNQQTSAQKERLRKAQEDLVILGESKVWGPRDYAYRQLEPRQVNQNRQKHLLAWPNGGAAAAQASTEFSPAIATISSDAAWISSTVPVDLGPSAPSWIGQNTTLKFKWMRLSIQRKWFDEGIFVDDSWRHVEIVADGEGGGSIGRYVSSLIAVKDVSITVASPNGAKRAIKAELESSDRVSFGGIPIADKGSENGPYVAFISTTPKQMNIPFLVILGCVYSNIPKSPMPNQSYQW